MLKHSDWAAVLYYWEAETGGKPLIMSFTARLFFCALPPSTLILCAASTDKVQIRFCQKYWFRFIFDGMLYWSTVGVLPWNLFFFLQICSHHSSVLERTVYLLWLDSLCCAVCLAACWRTTCRPWTEWRSTWWSRRGLTSWPSLGNSRTIASTQRW